MSHQGRGKADGLDDIAAQRFEDAFARADQVPGWLSRDQARVLWDEAKRLRTDADVVEIGSHLGRSTTVLAAATGGRVTAVDPFLSNWRYGAADTRERFEANLAAAGVLHRVRVLARPSTELRRQWHEAIDLLYVDGKHDFWTVADDLRWAEHVRPGGRVLVHDAFSSVGVTLALLRHAVPSRGLRYLDREGSLARFEVATMDRGSWLRMLGQLPWWLRNVAVKVLLRLRLRPVARALGHADCHDPY